MQCGNIYQVYFLFFISEVYTMADDERIAKLIKFPKELVQKIEQYQKKNYLSSFAAAIYELVRIGLEARKN